MATKQYSALDLQHLPLLGLRLENLASAPGSPNPGDTYYDTVLGYARVWNGSAWVRTAVANIVDADIASGAAIALSKLASDPLARANHTGTQLANTISNFDTQVRTSRLDQLAAPTAAVALNSQRITGLADPSSSSSQDAATANWVTNQLATVLSGQDWKASVRVRATSNITVAAPGTTIDGVAMAANDRVLLTGQSTASENGIYVWTASGTPMTRPSDANSTATVTAGLTVAVEAGTGADTIWLLTTDNPITVGTTALAFTQISGAGAYSAGTGLTLTGNTFSLTTPVAVANGGTGASSAATARTALGVAQKGFASDVGAMSAGSGLAIAHGLGTADIAVCVRDKTSGAFVDLDITVDATNITLTSGIAVSASALRVVAVPVV